MNKFIFVSGGVCSSLGKGVAASSLGALLEGRGLNVRMVKCDPYINVDAGTMSPYQHGEVYVTDDGAETDLDLGNYARFTSSPLSKANSVTTGQVYESVIKKEREGRYLGRCVQVIPHITDEIKARIQAVAKEDTDTDIVIVEIGGTVGDIESIPFLEAARQLIHEAGRGNAISVHLTLIPEVAGGELKTKPTQHSVKAMQEQGIQPDVLICRAPVMLDEATRRKIGLFTNMESDAVFTSYDIDTTIYEIPLVFYEQKLDQVVLKKLGIEARHANLKSWHSMMDRFRNRKGKVRIGIVGKYMELHDSYKSVYEALFHSGLECGVEVELVKIDSARLEESEPAESILGAKALGGGIDGILVPGGFGQRGIKGMVKASAWARNNKIPYFGICLGMQIMVIDWGRNVLGWEDADSTEFNQDTKHPVVGLLEEQIDVKNYGGTMRLGASLSFAQSGSKFLAAYKEPKVSERHRHRYEFANIYRKEMTETGLKIGALTEDGSLVECVEWPNHPWGLGVQFHPEFKSKPTAASPLFRDFIAAARDVKQTKG
ncbi:CTP synthase [Leadbettera azotonutricia]|uniref:CTP synthase n=1 Tax=Leadbettera azotonutricia (strain ATCC BAA-888 / DSM 13862 / ZAS-9) TaxID=545695 RepID=F5YBD5_LEAAZ|nr:CTP synthase [Leadbettera azotonutricia]AEF83317.1 CTP synthase [Leadbettera azotonutricia ZAS-9]